MAQNINIAFSVALVVFMLACHIGAAPDEAQILVKFKSSLSNLGRTLDDWNPSVHPPCNGDRPNWTGLRCNKDGTIFGLRVENTSLKGIIDIETLSELPGLRALSFMNNRFDGPMPNIKNLTALKALYLSYNLFSGEIPEDGFTGMKALQKVYLARNMFTGRIPKSLAALPRLAQLSLEGNQFEGRIPDFRQKNLVVVDLANNRLHGRIPASLSKMNSTSFSGNEELCGKPLQPCKSSNKRTIITIAIVVVSVIVTITLAAISAVSYLRSRRTKSLRETQALGKAYGGYNADRVEAQAQSADPYHNYKAEAENGILHFVRNDRERFKLHDLLRAAAQVLGSGSFGSSYKAVLSEGPAMVVKRFRQMNNVGKQEFHKHMMRLGMWSHPNLLPLVAYYYRKEEKLLVYDFVPNGSLASHLHGKRGPDEAALDWPTRLKIIKGVARGLAYLYTEFPRVALPHGHLKSSNVLLDHALEPQLADYGLVPVTNREHAQQFMVAYKSPEHDRTTRKTDVWTLGILILELLTGKFPANYLRQGKGGNEDLATWVNSVVREEWTAEVFDKDMKATKNGEGEMLKLLKIGMCCCEWNVERRWELSEAVEKILDLKERDSDTEDCSFDSVSEGDFYSSRALTDDDFSFSVNG